MPAASSAQRTKFDRGSEVILCERGGSAVNLTAYDQIQIEYIVSLESTFYVIGEDDEATFESDGTDGRVKYNPPSGGWTVDCSLAVKGILNGVPERFPAAGEIEIRVLEPGTAPA